MVDDDAGGGATATWHVRRVAAEVCVLTVVDGNDRGRTMELFDETVIGSSPEAHFRLADPTVSRLHVRLRAEPGYVEIEDLGSKNGVWVGGCRVALGRVVPPIAIRIGGTTAELTTARGTRAELVWTGGARFSGMIGASVPMQRLFAATARLAYEDAPALIRGESGTGKELVARALHFGGSRAQGPFVVVDGASLSPDTADLELFGNVVGAFTGADVERPGAFERAHGGTVFIDEIGELPIEVQAKLLRAVDDGTVQRLGSSDRLRVDVRIVTATHRPLEQMVNQRAFREDLYHRLSVLTLSTPPLRDRGDDVQLIARDVLEQVAPGDASVRASVERALADRAGHPWPGNVRELKSLVRRVAALGGDASALAPDARSELVVRTDLPYKEAKQKWAQSFERRYLARLIDEAGGNISEAARRAGMDRSHLSEMLGALGLRPRRR